MRYSAFGLLIESNRRLAGLPSAESFEAARGPDITIEWSADLASPVAFAPHQKWMARTDGGDIVLAWEGIAAFRLSFGQRVTVTPWLDASDESIQLYLLGAVLAILLQQRGWAVLHGSSITLNGQTIVMVGESGSGKSTLAATLTRRGHTLLEDDTTPVVMRDGVACAVPGTGRMKLWPDSAEALGATDNLLHQVKAGETKRWLRAQRHAPATFHPIERIYFLKRGDSIAIETVAPVEGVLLIVGQSYGARLLELNADGDIQRTRFENAAAIARAVPLRILTRPWSLGRLDDVAAAIESDVRS